MTVTFTTDDLVKLLTFVPEGDPLETKLVRAVRELNGAASGSFPVTGEPARVSIFTEVVTEQRALVPGLLEVPADRKRGPGGCIWETYGHYCHVDAPEGEAFCGDHKGRTCRNCGKAATHGCPMELQFVCGAPLCDDCTFCAGH